MTVPSEVGVIGGGRMGVGIAHAFLLAGANTVILERDADAAAQALAAIESAVLRSVERGSAGEDAATLLERCAVTTEVQRLATVGLAVEAVPEDPELKIAMLGRVEAVLADDAWLATNTSSLSIALLAAGLARPERFCGLHFFNPVPSSTLVEIVRGAGTSDELTDAARDWVHAIGKTPIVVNDSPGFASSRLGVVVALEAIRMLEDGVASAEDIDTAMVLGYKFPVGPLHLTDLVGLDVRLGIAEYLHGALGERFAPPALLREKVAAGLLGRKSGEGFFTWPEPKPTGEPHTTKDH
ncbi:3-hydroxybutyryl-CoA dehydrogenase [Microterricola gilva]|uniref:3-hydroxybutyryl-CoA dehydrogenase n=1 Tax=Microterricola gilva TaxID=393267 RepID=A0A4Q8AKS2_9MICO|nr:3-hydroxyacyl-CoA dehydrogenase family protein [Microterricola gilva]RZU65132.1 3-hydroxybutyryl-CoA dehydrogenase [Microterricola gilva]